MCANPTPVLKRMAIEDVILPLGGLPHMGKNRLRCYQTAKPVKERIAHRSHWAARYVRNAVNVEGDPPPVRMFVTLHTECIVRQNERPMDLAGNDAAKAKNATHELV